MGAVAVLEQPARLRHRQAHDAVRPRRRRHRASTRSGKARATDPVSAFGSVVAFNTVVDEATAHAMSDLFVEVVVAPSFHEEALAVFARKKNLRVIELPVSRGAGTLDYKRVRGGLLVQDRFAFDPSTTEWTVHHQARSRPSASGPICRSPGPRWRRSSRTRSCSPATRRRSASAPGR